MDRYFIDGEGFSVRVDVNEDARSQLGAIVQGVIDATLGIDDSLTVRRAAK